MLRKHESGRPRVTVRAYYEGLPLRAGRGPDEGGESRRMKGGGCLLSVPGSTVPRTKKSPRWSAERRARFRDLKRALPRRLCAAEVEDCAFRRSAPSGFSRRVCSGIQVCGDDPRAFVRGNDRACG